jgi:hypothetical protein
MPYKDSYHLCVSRIETEQVRAAIQELPVQFREIICCGNMKGLSYREIAITLHCPVGTMMSRLGERVQSYGLAPFIIVKRSSVVKVDRQLDARKIEFLRSLRIDSQRGTSGSRLLPIDPETGPLGVQVQRFDESNFEITSHAVEKEFESEAFFLGTCCEELHHHLACVWNHGLRRKRHFPQEGLRSNVVSV